MCTCVWGGREGRGEGEKELRGRRERERYERCVHLCVCVYMCGGGGRE